MLIIDALICTIFFRLHAGQGVLSVPSGAVASGHCGPLRLAVRNEHQDIRLLETI
jgi:hypothetical protein